MNRQSIIVILIGAIASLSGFATLDYLRGKRCAELGGIWTSTTRECRLEGGAPAGTLELVSMLAGIVVALAVGFMLYRVLLFAMGRARSAASR